jgi:hypothetical protein
MTGGPMSLNLIVGVPSQDEHTARAITLIRDLGNIYEGSRARPFSRSADNIALSGTEPAPPGQDVGAAPVRQARTILAALYLATASGHDRTGTCGGCTGQPPSACPSFSLETRAYGQVLARLLQPAEASAAIPANQPQAPADREAGQ